MTAVIQKITFNGSARSVRLLRLYLYLLQLQLGGHIIPHFKHFKFFSVCLRVTDTLHYTLIVHLIYTKKKTKLTISQQMMYTEKNAF